MKNKIIAFLLTTVMLAGCTANNSSPSNNAKRSEEIMASVEDTKVPYGDFLGYIDITEELAKLIARENMAYCEMLKKDLAATENGFDAETFQKSMEEMVGEELDYILGYEDMQHTIKTVSDKAGLTPEQYREAALLDYAPTMLSEMMNEQIYFTSGEDAEAYFEAMEKYTTAFDNRTDFSDSNILVKLDEEAIPMSDTYKNYLTYSGLMARANAIHTISLNKVVYDKLVAEGMKMPEEGFEEHKAEVMQLFAADEVYQLLLPKALTALGMSQEDYLKALDPYLYLSFATETIDNTLNAMYDKLPAEQRPETVEQFKQEYYTKLSTALKIENIKP